MPAKTVVLDFETKPIEKGSSRRPAPVGLAVKNLTPNPRYLAWGHASGNGIYELRKGKLVTVPGDPERIAKEMFRDAVKGRVLGHNIAKFDLPVAEDHWKIAPPSWDKVDDTLLSLFLDDPHASSLSLKPSAERLLDEAPEERDAVFEWLAAQGKIAKPRTKDGKVVYAKDAGAHIWEAPGDLVARYGIGDTTRPEALHALLMPRLKKLKMLESYDRERRLAPILLANERRGMRVDMEGLERDVPRYEAALAKTDLWLRKKLKAPGLNLDSDIDVAAALKRSGVVKDFPKTPTGRDSVSKKALTRKKFSDPAVFDALYYRNALVTVLTMSMRRWLEEGSKYGGYIHTEWNQVRQSHGNDGFRGARSGRITCSYFQNITKDFSDRGDDYAHPAFLSVPELPLVREYLLPDPDEEWGHIDYNQQELRLVAHYEMGELAQAYINDPSTDIHTYVQQLIKKVTGKEFARKFVKTINFRTVYGGGVTGLVPGLGLDALYGCPPGCPHASCEAKKQAATMVAAWKAALPGVVRLDSECKERFRNGEHLRTYGGRVYFCKPPTIAKKGARKGEWVDFAYTGLNYLIQPSGADVTKQALINYDQARTCGRLVVTVHDEINLSVPKGGRGKKEMKLLKECMESIKLDVPWRSEMKMGPKWGKLTKVEQKEKAA